MVTTKGLWQTTEAGKNWRKLPKAARADLPRLLHRREERLRRRRSRRRCSRRTTARRPGRRSRPPRNRPGTRITACIAGSLSRHRRPASSPAGTCRRAREAHLPDWLDPEAAINRRDVPHLSYSLETARRRQDLEGRSASLFGQVTRVRFDARRARDRADRVRARRSAIRRRRTRSTCGSGKSQTRLSRPEDSRSATSG